MSQSKKSIDGLVIKRPNNEIRTVGLNPKAPKKSKTSPTTLSQPKHITKKPKKEDIDLISKPEPVTIKSQTSTTEDFLSPVGTLNLDLTSDDLKKTKKANKKLDKKSKKCSKKKKVIIIILSIILAIILAIAIWISVVLAKLTNGNDNIFGAIGAIWSNVPLKADSNGRTNVLIFGTSGYDMDGNEGNGVHDGAQLTDSIMVISANQETKDVAMMSLPRDLKVSMACSAGKINEVYWCNNQDKSNEIAGAEALKTQVSEILGIDFQYYVHVNWSALVSIVDSIGGITVTLDEDIADSWTNTYIEAGTPTTLNGEQAVGLARARHGTASGDFTRGNSQQKILIAIEQKILEQGIDVTEAFNLMNVIGDNVRMDFNTDEIKTVLNLVSKDDGFNLNNMRQIPFTNLEDGPNYFTTANINGISYVVPSAGASNYLDIKKYVKKQLDNNPVIREDATILVLNGSGTSGAASEEKDKLETDNFNVKAISDAPAPIEEEYTVYMLNDKKTGTKSVLESRYNTTVKTAAELPAGISTTCDFVVIVGPKPAPTEN